MMQPQSQKKTDPSSRAARLYAQLVEIEAAPGWRRCRGPPGVSALVLDQFSFGRGTYPVVRCVVSLAAPAADLFQFLVSDVTETLPAWSRDIEACDEIQRLSPSERILLVRTRAPWYAKLACVAPREDLFFVHANPASSYEVSEVEDGASFQPAKPGAVRSVMHFASKRVVPLDAAHCRYEVMWSYDPMGALSAWLPRWVAVKLVHDHMKDECARLLAKFHGCPPADPPPAAATTPDASSSKSK